MFEWLKRRLATGGRQPSPGMITRTCKYCGKAFTLPEEVQHWPDCCQACRAKLQPAEMITGTCRRCGKKFTFPSSARPWPKRCKACQAGQRRQAER